MAKEKITIQINNEVVELKGAELEAFLEDRKKTLEEQELRKQEQEAQKELKISAYKKLGLTDEEIAAII
jgi:hypothetical protein